MKRATREWVFSVMADQLEEMGDMELSRFFRLVEHDPDGLAAEMLEYLGTASHLTYQEGKDSWQAAAANFAALEMNQQNLGLELLPNIGADAVDANEDILQDGVVEIARHPRVILEAGGYPGGPARLRVSGWFLVNIDRDGEAQPNPLEDWNEEEEEYYDPPPRWSELNHEQQMRLLQTVTGFDQESISISSGEIWGRPYRNYAFAGMKVRWGTLSKALEQARQIGYIADD